MNTSTNGKGISIAGLVLGLVAICTGIIFYISIPTGVVGIILSAISLKKKYDGRGMALAGLITAIIGTVFGIGVLIVGIAVAMHNGGTTDTTY